MDLNRLSCHSTDISTLDFFSLFFLFFFFVFFLSRSAGLVSPRLSLSLFCWPTKRWNAESWTGAVWRRGGQHRVEWWVTKWGLGGDDNRFHLVFEFFFLLLHLLLLLKAGPAT